MTFKIRSKKGSKVIYQTGGTLAHKKGLPKMSSPFNFIF